MKINKHINKILILFIAGIMLAGCGKAESKITQDFASTLNTSMRERISKNKSILDTFYQNGFISDATYSKYNAELKNAKSAITEKVITFDTNAQQLVDYDDENASVNGLSLNILNSVVRIIGYSSEAIAHATGEDTYVDEVLCDGKTVKITHSLKINSSYSNQTPNNMIFSNMLLYGIDADLYINALPSSYRTKTVKEGIKSLRSKVENLVVTLDYKSELSDITDARFYGSYIYSVPNTEQGEEHKKYVAYKMVDEEVADEIAERFNYPIYVLKPLEDSGRAPEEYVKSLKNVIESAKSGKAKMADIEKWFQPLYRDDGGKLTFLDVISSKTGITDPRIIRYSDDLGSSFNTGLSYSSYKQELGKDLVVFQKLDDDIGNKAYLPLMEMKFLEFDEQTCNVIFDCLETDTNTKDKYMFVTTSDAGKSSSVQGGDCVLLLEYPVYYIKSLSTGSAGASGKPNWYCNDTNLIVQTSLFSSASDTDQNRLKNYFSNANIANVTIDKSCLSLNIATGKLNKNIIRTSSGTIAVSEGASSSIETEELEFVNQERYLNFGGDPNNSSFILMGNHSIEFFMDYHSDKFKITSIGPSIILRDYIEATYAPDLVPGENLVAFGRKFRFTNLGFITGTSYVKTTYAKKLIEKYQTTINYYAGYTIGALPYSAQQALSEAAVMINAIENDPSYKENPKYYKKQLKTVYYVDESQNLGEFVDINGNKTTDANIKASDLCGIADLSARSTISRLNFYNADHTDKNGTKDEYGNYNGVEDLPVKYEFGISPTSVFPKNSGDVSIAHIDVDGETRTREVMYTISTSKGIFNSGLFSTWINVTNPNASLDWWNNYLTAHGFKYQVGHTDINTYVKGRYAYELGQSGVTVLDLEVIGHIQQEFDKKADAARTRFIRTLFIIFGFFLILYSVVLALVWILDTNFDIGFKLLTKLTFGQWIAVKTAYDIPSKEEDVRYVDSKALVSSVIGLMAIGIILINIDIIRIVAVLVKIYGGILDTLAKMFKN